MEYLANLHVIRITVVLCHQRSSLSDSFQCFH